MLPRFRRAKPSVVEPTSDRLILAIAFAVGMFICLVSAVANAFLMSTGNPVAAFLMKCNAVGGIVAILLIWKLLRWSRERNQLIRERTNLILGLNDEIRNAIQAISLADYKVRGENGNSVQESVTRIEHALNEYVPADLLRRSGPRRPQL